MDKELISVLKKIEANQKDLITKYNVLVKRTNSIITSLSQIDTKIEYLVETMSMFETDEDDEGEYDGFESYSQIEDEEELDEDE